MSQGWGYCSVFVAVEFFRGGLWSASFVALFFGFTLAAGRAVISVGVADEWGTTESANSCNGLRMVNRFHGWEGR